MTSAEIRAVLSELNDQDLNQMRQTRLIAYAAAAPFYDKNSQPKEVSIEQFWPLPGDAKPEQTHNPEVDEKIAIRLCEILNKKHHVKPKL